MSFYAPYAVNGQICNIERSDTSNATKDEPQPWLEDLVNVCRGKKGNTHLATPLKMHLRMHQYVEHPPIYPSANFLPSDYTDVFQPIVHSSHATGMV